MKSIIDIIIAILFILFGLNVGVKFIHKEVKKATIKTAIPHEVVNFFQFENKNKSSIY